MTDEPVAPSIRDELQEFPLLVLTSWPGRSHCICLQECGAYRDTKPRNACMGPKALAPENSESSQLPADFSLSPREAASGCRENPRELDLKQSLAAMGILLAGAIPVPGQSLSEWA